MKTVSRMPISLTIRDSLESLMRIYREIEKKLLRTSTSGTSGTSGTNTNTDNITNTTTDTTTDTTNNTTNPCYLLDHQRRMGAR
jgi:hypothetical protein